MTAFWQPDPNDITIPIVREAYRRDRNRRKGKRYTARKAKAAKAHRHHMRHRHSENRGGVPNPPPKPKARRSHVTRGDLLRAELASIAEWAREMQQPL